MQKRAKPKQFTKKNTAKTIYIHLMSGPNNKL